MSATRDYYNIPLQQLKLHRSHEVSLFGFSPLGVGVGGGYLLGFFGGDALKPS